MNTDGVAPTVIYRHTPLVANEYNFQWYGGI